jgi:hypothetical protein
MPPWETIARYLEDVKLIVKRTLPSASSVTLIDPNEGAPMQCGFSNLVGLRGQTQPSLGIKLL